MTNDERERQLTELKARIDSVHEVILRAFRSMDERAVDRAMDEQHELMQEYTALRRQLTNRPRDSR
jgi:hypothetical protein